MTAVNNIIVFFHELLKRNTAREWEKNTIVKLNSFLKKKTKSDSNSFNSSPPSAAYMHH